MVAIFLEGGGERVAEKLGSGDEGGSVAGSVDNMIQNDADEEDVIIAVTIPTSA